MSSQYAGDDLFPTDYAIPADSDSRDATSVNVALEALGDRTKYLHNRTDDAWRIVAHDSVALGGAPAEYRTLTETTAWTLLTDFADPAIVYFSDLKAGDVITVWFAAPLYILSPKTLTVEFLGKIDIGEGYAQMPGMYALTSKKELAEIQSAETSVAMNGQYRLADDATAVTIRIEMKLNLSEAGSTITVYKPLSLMAQVIRKNHPVGPS